MPCPLLLHAVESRRLPRRQVVCLAEVSEELSVVSASMMMVSKEMMVQHA